MIPMSQILEISPRFALIQNLGRLFEADLIEIAAIYDALATIGT